MQRRYDRLITVQRKAVMQSGSGQETAVWADIAYRIAAFVAPTRGSERMTTAQEIAEQEVTFTTRFHSIPPQFRPLNAQDRILYPADDLTRNVQTPDQNLIFDILSPDEVGRQADLSIKSKRRNDVRV